jgi:hypothetical protein
VLYETWLRVWRLVGLDVVLCTVRSRVWWWSSRFVLSIRRWRVLSSMTAWRLEDCEALHVGASVLVSTVQVRLLGISVEPILPGRKVSSGFCAPLDDFLMPLSPLTSIMTSHSTRQMNIPWLLTATFDISSDWAQVGWTIVISIWHISIRIATVCSITLVFWTDSLLVVIHVSILIKCIETRRDRS